MAYLTWNVLREFEKQYLDFFREFIQLPKNKQLSYQVKVPEQMRSAGQDYDVLIEVSLSFMAKPRRTRRKTQSYLSTWLDWESSKLNEKIRSIFESSFTKYGRPN